ncbi:MAG: LptE family protein [Bacteroidota bacterium]
MKMHIFFSAVFLFVCGCGVYSFTGSSVPTHLKTIAIPLFDDQSGFGQPHLREQFTNKIIEKIVSDNSLLIAEKNSADATLEGTITKVVNEAAVVNPGEIVAQKKITITVTVSMFDKVMKKKMWEKSFSNWGNYDIGSGIPLMPNGIDVALEKLTDDIVLATISNW